MPQGNYSFPFTAPGQHSGAQSLAGGGAGLGMLGSVGVPLLNWLGQDARWSREYHAQQEMAQNQYSYQRKLNQQGHDLNYAMWLKTNFPQQVAQMKKAGLSPALMYGGGPGSGGTTGGQSGGSAQMGGTPGVQPMDMDNLLLGQQLDYLRAQTSNMDADTGVKKEKIKETQAVTENQLIQNTIDRMYKDGLTKHEARYYESILAEMDTKISEKNIKAFEERVAELKKELNEDGFYGNGGEYLATLLEGVLGMDTKDLDTNVSYEWELPEYLAKIMGQKTWKIGMSKREWLGAIFGISYMGSSIYGIHKDNRQYELDLNRANSQNQSNFWSNIVGVLGIILKMAK